MQEHDPCREAFEAWAAYMDGASQSIIALSRQGEDHYCYLDLTLRWQAWREAWKSRGEYETEHRVGDFERRVGALFENEEVPNAD